MPPKLRTNPNAVAAPTLSLKDTVKRQTAMGALQQGRALADMAQTPLVNDAVPSLAGLQQEDTKAKMLRQAIQQRGMTSTGLMGIQAEPLGTTYRKRNQMQAIKENAIESNVTDAIQTIVGVEESAKNAAQQQQEADLDSGSKTVLTVVVFGAVLAALLAAM